MKKQKTFGTKESDSRMISRSNYGIMEGADAYEVKERNHGCHPAVDYQEV